MLVNGETAILGDFGLAPLDFGVHEFFNLSALQAHQVVVMGALVQLEHRLAGLEVMPDEDARLFELGEHAVYRG